MVGSLCHRRSAKCSINLVNRGSAMPVGVYECDRCGKKILEKEEGKIDDGVWHEGGLICHHYCKSCANSMNRIWRNAFTTARIRVKAQKCPTCDGKGRIYSDSSSKVCYGCQGKKRNNSKADMYVLARDLVDKDFWKKQ